MVCPDILFRVEVYSFAIWYVKDMQALLPNRLLFGYFVLQVSCDFYF